MESKLWKVLLFYLLNNKKSTLFGGHIYMFNISCSAQSGGEISFDSKVLQFRLESTWLFPPR